MLLVLISVFALLVSTTQMNVGATVTGTPSPVSGDWIIDNATTITGETIILDGNLFVNDGGSLTLDNTTLKMNCSKDGEFGIFIKNGGAITIKSNSYITKNGTGNFPFQVEAGASFSMADSKLEYCGYQKDGHDYQKDYAITGLYIKCDGTIENSVIDNCLQGIICEDNTFTVKGTTVKNSFWHNIEGRNTKNFVLLDSVFTGKIVANAGELWSCKCNVEFYEGCTGSIKNCKISFGGSNNVWCMTNNTVTIENCEIWGATKNGIWASGNCDLTIKNNIIKENTRSGLWIGDNSKVICTDNTIKDNGILTMIVNDKEQPNPSWDETGHGFAAFDSEVTFSDNIVGNNWGHNFETTRCKTTFEGNNFTASRQKCNVEFFDHSDVTARNNYIDGAGHNCFWVRDGVKALIENNIMKNSPHNGIWAGNLSELTIKNNVIDNCVENGIYSYNCTLTIEDNEIKNCGDYGIYGEGSTITESDNTFTAVAKGERKLNFYIHLKTVDEEKAVLGETDLTLKDSNGNIIWSGSTDIKGKTPVIFVNDIETYTAEADWGELKGTFEFTPDKNGEYVVELKEDAQEDNMTMMILIAIVVIIVLALIIVMAIKRRKK